MGGELGVESAKTINRTAIVLHCNCLAQEDMPVRAILAECYARCITYSLYGHLRICESVQAVVARLMGQKWVKVVLLDIRRLF